MPTVKSEAARLLPVWERSHGFKGMGACKPEDITHVVIRWLFGVLNLHAHFVPEPSVFVYCGYGEFAVPPILVTDPSRLLHELGHWVVASKSDRKLPEFGLGIAYDFAADTSDLWGTARNSIAQSKPATAVAAENCASIYGILCERDLGMPWQTTYSNHSWDCDQGEPTIANLRKIPEYKRLVRQGFATAQGNVVWPPPLTGVSHGQSVDRRYRF